MILIKPITQRKFSKTHTQFIRYTIVGGVAFIADFGSLYVMKEWGGLNYLLAATLAFLLGLLINYQLSIFWVFDQRAVDNKYIEFLIFSVIGILGVFLNLGIILLLTEKLEFFYLYSKLIATAIILIFNFSTRKIYLFTR